MRESKFKNTLTAISWGIQGVFAFALGTVVITGRRIRWRFLPDDTMRTRCIFWSGRHNDTVEADVKMYKTGDDVCFTYKGQNYEKPNTSVIWYTRNAKRHTPTKNPAYYFCATLPDGTFIDDYCSHYEDDPACQNSPGYVIYNGDLVFHIAKVNVKFMKHDNKKAGDAT